MERTLARLAGMFQAAFPDYYEKYRKAFEAGCWAKEDNVGVGLVDGLDTL